MRSSSEDVLEIVTEATKRIISKCIVLHNDSTTVNRLFCMFFNYFAVLRAFLQAAKLLGNVGYALLTEIGEFSFASARIVGAVVGGRAFLPVKELLPIIQAQAAARRNIRFSQYVPWAGFDPDRRLVCREIAEDWAPWFAHPRYRNHFLSM